MILKKCKIEYSNAINTKLGAILGEDYSIKRFHSEEFDRDYNVFMLESQNCSVVLKKTSDMDEVHSYNLLSETKDNNTPSVFFIYKDEETYWIAMEYIESFLEDWTKEHIEDLVVRLATIHTSISEKDASMHRFRRWKHESRDELNDFVDSEIREKHIEVIHKSHLILMNSFKTFVHGDMIPLNMIITEKGVKIIDWEYGHIGPYVLDIGRLLADYNIDKPWINSEWESDILKSYYQTLRNRGVEISYDQLFLEYQCARLENYFGIVSSFKIRKWERTEWYDLNLREMINSINTIDSLLTNSV